MIDRLVRSTEQSDGAGGGIAPTMGNADENGSNVPGMQVLFDSSMNADMRLAATVVRNFDVCPAHSLGPTGAERFENRFLGRPATRKMLHGTFALPTVSNLFFRENALQKRLAMLLQHASDTCAFDNIGADAEYPHGLACSASSFSLSQYTK